MPRRSRTITAGKVKKLVEKSNRLNRSKLSAGGVASSPSTEAEIKLNRRSTQLVTIKALNKLKITDKIKRAEVHKLAQAIGNEYNQFLIFGKQPNMEKLSSLRATLIALLGGEKNYKSFVQSGVNYTNAINRLKLK